MPRTDEFVTVDGVEMHYSAWGDPDAPPVVCVHGLSRVGRDFDPLARTLADEYRVLCPDMPGRGWSDWGDPDATYADGPMVARLAGFCERLDLDSVRFVGTSMGGGLGMALAGGPLADRVTHLVVNDVSPAPAADADPEAFARIMEYVPHPPTRDSVTDLEGYYRDVYEGRFSPMSDAEWRRFTVTSARRTDDGGVAPAYDPRILDYGDQTDENGEEEGDNDQPDPWDVWAAIEAALMVVRGTDSQILPEDAFERMLAAQPDAGTLDVDCGHAPALNTPEQTGPIREFLSG